MGSIGLLSDSEFCMAVLGVPSGPIAFAATLGFKIRDSQPDSSSMGPVPTVDTKMTKIMKIIENGLRWLEMG